MSGRDRLLEEIRRTQDQGTADQVAEARARLFASPAPRRQPWAMGLAAGLVGALFIAAALWGGAPAPEVRLVGSEEALPSAWISVPPDSTQPFAFSDGTVVIAAPGARARVLTTSAKGGRVAVERGKISVSVPPQRGAEWSFEVGPFTVLVTGTRFDVGWDAPAEVFDLEMREGSVKVSGPTIVGLTTVEVGQRLRIALAPQREAPTEASAVLPGAAVARAAADAPSPLPVVEAARGPRREARAVLVDQEPREGRASTRKDAVAEAPAKPGREAVSAAEAPAKPGREALSAAEAPAKPGREALSAAEAPAKPVREAPAMAEPQGPRSAPDLGAARAPERSPPALRWQDLLGAGKYREGLALVPDFERECRASTAKDVLLLADAARYLGRKPESERAHRILRERFPGSAEAALAAFGLGRLRFEAADDEAAVRWLELYLAESPDGLLEPEALGRMLEARIRSGAPEDARRIARRYLARAPSGPLAAAARELLEPAR